MSRDNDKKEDVEEKKINVATFLSMHPQEYMVSELMKSIYGLSLMTESEWDETLRAVLKKDITQ